MAFALDHDVAQERYFLTEREHEGPPPGRELEHARKPYLATTNPDAATKQAAQELAAAYLSEPAVADFFGLQPGPVAHLKDEAGGEEPDRRSLGVGLRWLPPVVVRCADGTPETIAVIVQQTFLPDWLGGSNVPDVWGGGLRLIVHTRPLRVTSASSTLVHDVAPVQTQAIRAKARAGQFTPEAPDPHVVGRQFSFSTSGPRLAGDAKVAADEGYLIYRFDPEDLRETPRPRAARKLAPSPAFRAEQAEDYLVQLLHVDVPPPGIEQGEPGYSKDQLVYRVFTTVPEGAAIYYRLLGTNIAHGLVFDPDPVSRAGLTLCPPRDPQRRLPPLPQDYNHCLDQLRSRVQLQGLTQLTPQALSGDFAEVVAPNPLGLDPPVVAGPDPEFGFHARTDDFAAVNAYHHVDKMVRFVHELGFELTEYFHHCQFPLAVVHRAGMFPTPCHDGRCINAQVLPAPGADTRLVKEIRLALGDLSDQWRNPLGVATDARWLWHEFCHVLLQASTEEMEFPFCHSAGDALAAIMSDPDSALADEAAYPPDPRKPEGPERGITFPFVWQPIRRHDRKACEGWGWFGAMHQPDDYPDERDPGGYRAEEIMSSTLFRLYRALGGDAGSGANPDRPRRRAAARRVAFLILAAIRALGPVRAAPALRVGPFAAALAAADVGCAAPQPGTAAAPGGCVHKVVRWAFERQGHFQPPGAAWPQNRPGAPPRVDVALDDGDGGYDHRADWRAPPSALWVLGAPAAAAPQAGAGDVRPQPNRRHYVYAAIRNFGYAPAWAMDVRIYAAAGGDIHDWPNGWALLPRGGGAFPAAIPARSAEVYGPFLWDAPGAGPAALLCVVGAAGDRANLDPLTQLPCALAASVALADVVPYDNNLGYRRWRLS
jgi:hypothetical protein